MKVNFDNEVTQTSGYVRNKAANAGIDFQSVLKKAVESADKSAVSEAAAGINFEKTAVLQPDPTMIALGCEHLLDTMDRYREMLANQDVSLKALSPLITEMEKEKQALSEMMDGLTETGGLKQILENTLVNASLAVIQFNRGDFT